MSKVKLSPFVRVRDRVRSDTVGDTMCQREHAPDCDINIQIARFKALGVSPFRRPDPASFKDVSEMSTDFLSAHEHLQAGHDAFQALPEDLRQRFNDDPLQYWGFLHDEENYDEAVELGLVTPKGDIKHKSEAERAPPDSAVAKPPKSSSTPPKEGA